MLVRPLPGQALEAPTLVPIGGKHQPKKMKSVGEPEKPKEEAKAEPKKKKPKKKEAPKKPSGKHKDREVLYRSKPKDKNFKVSMSEEQRATFLPEGLSDAARKATEEGLGKAPRIEVLQQLASNVQAALDDPEGPYAQALSGAGYKPGDLSKMNATLKDMLKGADGIKYNDTMLDVWNRNDLEEEDAEELRAWREEKPDTGRKMSWEQLKQKFLQETKSPETRERMQEMSLEDFKAAYVAIMDDEEEDL